MNRVLIIVLLCVTGVLAGNNSGAKTGVRWSAQTTQTTFAQSGPITFAYEFVNTSRSPVLVPKKLNPYMSMRFYLRDPDGRELQWNGARFTFRYEASDFVTLEAGKKMAGVFSVPVACQPEPQFEKGGYCFNRLGKYFGIVEFRLGANAIYRRRGLSPQLAEGPYKSKQFIFIVE